MIIKILIILLMYDFVGFLFNNKIFSLERKYNILIGFTSLVSINHMFSMIFIIKHVPLFWYELFVFSIGIVILIWLMVRHMYVFKLYYDTLNFEHSKHLIYVIVLFGLLVIFSVSGLDQWLYGAMTNNTIYGLQSQAGFLQYDLTTYTSHMLNSYTVFNGLLIDVFNINFFSFTYGGYRLIEAIIFIQALRLLSEKSDNKDSFTLLFFGLLGISIFSVNMFSADELALLFNGNLQTFMWMFVGTILFYEFLYSENERLLYLYLLFSFATTTSIIPIFPIVLIIVSFVKSKKYTNSTLLYLLLFIPYIIGMSTVHIIIICFMMLILFLVYKYIDNKILIITMFLLTFIVITELDMYASFFLVRNTPKKYIVSIGTLLILEYSKRHIRNDLVLFSQLLLIISFLLEPSARFIPEQFLESINVIRYRLIQLAPICVIAVTLFKPSGKLRILSYFYMISIILYALFISPPYSQLRDAKSVINDFYKYSSFEEYYIDSPDLYTMIQQIKDYEKVDVFFNFDYADYDLYTPESENNPRYLSAYRSGISSYFMNYNYTPLESYCSNADICLKVYPKDIYDEEDIDEEIEFDTYNFYVSYDTGGNND